MPKFLECKGCERRRQAAKAWLKELATKGKNLMGTVDKRKTAAIGAIAKQSGVSENTVARVIEAMQEVDAVGVALLLGFKEADVQTESVADATFEDADAPAGDASDGEGAGKGTTVTTLGKAADDS